MKKLYLPIVFFFLGFIMFGQSTNEISQRYFKNSQHKYFKLEDVTSDYGPRGNDHDFHGGIDLNDDSYGVPFVADFNASVKKIDCNLSGLKSILFENKIGYRHIFNGNCNDCPLDIQDTSYNINGFYFVNYGSPTSPKYSIITPYGKVFAEIGGDQFEFLGTTYVTSSIVEPSDIIAPIGNSGAYYCQGLETSYHTHLHVQKVQEFNPSSGNIWSDSNSDNVLMDFTYNVNPFINNHLLTVENMEGYPFLFRGESNIPVKVNFTFANLETIVNSDEQRRYPNAIFDLENISLEIKPIFGEYNTIIGNTREAYISLGSFGEIPTPNNVAQSGQLNKGSWNKTGIAPFAYSSDDYDDYYFTEFIPRIAEFDTYSSALTIADLNTESRYSDGNYHLRAKLITASNKVVVSEQIPIKIDNFYPYIERVLVIFSLQDVYHKRWKRNNSTLELIGPQEGVIFENGDEFRISVITSEPLEFLKLKIEGLPDIYNLNPNLDRTLWVYDIVYTGDTSQRDLIFTGEDTNGNGLLTANSIPFLSNHPIPNEKSNSKLSSLKQSPTGEDRTHKINNPNACQLVASAGQDVTIPIGGSVVLQGSGGSTYSWSPTTALSNTNIWNPIASPSETTTYTLTVTENGCTDTDQVTVYVDNISNGIPPPNDNCNDATILTSQTYPDFESGTVSNATESVGANQCTGCNCVSPDDFDVYYEFTAVSNSHTIHLDNLSNNFDAVIEIRSGCGINTNITCYDPLGTVSPMSFTHNNFEIGQTYYIRIFEWNYQGSPPTSSAFDICVTHNDTNIDGVDLITNITGVSDNNPDAGDQITIDYTASNIGDETTPLLPTLSLYISTNQNLGSADSLLGTDIILQNISSNETVTEDVGVTIPNVSDGQYFLISAIDNVYLIDESDEDNNLDFYPIQIGEVSQDGPDLDITGMTVNPNSGLAPGQEINVELEIDNDGNEDSDKFDVLVFLDINGNSEYESNEFMREFSFGSIDEGEDNTKDRDMFLPTDIPSTGTYEVIAIVDSNNDINETNEDNNDKGRNINIATITPAGPDLISNYISVEIDETNQTVSENSLCLGERYTFRFNTENIGSLEAATGGVSIRTYAYLSKDQILDGTDVIVGSDQASTQLSVGEINNGSADEQLEGFSEGQYYLLLYADKNEIVNEINEANNITSIPITIKNCNNQLLPDLKIDILSYTPYSSELGDYITVDMEISNIGEIEISDFRVSLHLSEDQVFHGNGGDGIEDNRLENDGWGYISQILQPNQSLTYSMTAFTSGDDVPITNTGIYYLFAVLDAVNDYNELSKTNNEDFVPIELTSIGCYYNITNEVDTISYNEPPLFMFYLETEDECVSTTNGVEDWIGFPNNEVATGDDFVYVSFNNENPYPFPRTGHIEINGVLFEFIQEARPCELLNSDIKISMSGSAIANIDCTSNGSINIAVQNGFPPYSYLWSNGETTQDIQDIMEPGNYTVTISDITECSISQTFTIIDAEPINSSVSIQGSTLVSAQDNADSYQWIRCDAGNTLVEGATGQSYDVLENGSYKVQFVKGDCNEESECVEAIWNYTNISISAPLEMKRTEDYGVEIVIENNGTLEVSESVIGKLYISEYVDFDSLNATLLSAQIVNPIVINGSYLLNESVSLPGDIPLGEYYFHFEVDAENNLNENDDSDNVITSIPVNVLSQYDLFVGNLELSGYQLSIHDTFAIEILVHNEGTATPSYFKYGVYFSQANVFDHNSAILLSGQEFPSILEPGQGIDFFASGIAVLETLPLGDGYLYFVIDSDYSIEENNEIDNVSAPYAINIELGTNSLDNLAQKNVITIYPNPSSEYLYLDLPTDQDWTNAQIRLFTSGGILVQNINSSISSSKLELNIHRLPPGAYTVYIRSKEYTWTKIIIKQ